MKRFLQKSISVNQTDVTTSDSHTGLMCVVADYESHRKIGPRVVTSRWRNSFENTENSKRIFPPIKNNIELTYEEPPPLCSSSSMIQNHATSPSNLLSTPDVQSNGTGHNITNHVLALCNQI